MAPAEIDIFKFREGRSAGKVHADENKDFTIGGDIKAKVSCDAFNTSVVATGEIRYLAMESGGKVICEGELSSGGFVRVFLSESQEYIKIYGKNSRNSLSVTHTEHDGSTGEVG